MEDLKPLEHIASPDERWRLFGVTLKDLHLTASGFRLNAGVPEIIRDQFAIAANAYVYAWNFYPFLSVALTYSILSIELALRWRLLKEAPGRSSQARQLTLYPLLVEAIKRRWIVDSGFDVAEPITIELPSKITKQFPVISDDQKYCYSLLDSLVSLRNDLAHGTPILMPSMGPLIVRGAELINQLYPDRNG